MSLLSDWLGGLHPDGRRFAAVLEALPCRATYADVDDGAGDPATRALAATELSVRGASSNALRFAFTLDSSRLRPGWIGRALDAMGVRRPDAPVRVVEALRQRHPGLDLLLGLDASGDRRRGKLYVLRDRRAPRSAFRAPLDLLLQAAGVDPGVVWRTLAHLPGGIAFTAIDLWPSDTPAKVYLDVDRAEARRALVALGRPALVDVLDALPDDRFGQPFGCVLTLRWAGSEVRDVTVHTRAPVDPAAELGDLGEHVVTLCRRADALGGALELSYLSWMDDGKGVVPTVYYQVRPVAAASGLARP